MNSTFFPNPQYFPSPGQSQTLSSSPYTPNSPSAPSYILLLLTFSFSSPPFHSNGPSPSPGLIFFHLGHHPAFSLASQLPAFLLICSQLGPKGVFLHLALALSHPNSQPPVAPHHPEDRAPQPVIQGSCSPIPLPSCRLLGPIANPPNALMSPIHFPEAAALLGTLCSRNLVTPVRSRSNVSSFRKPSKTMPSQADPASPSTVVPSPTSS